MKQTATVLRLPSKRPVKIDEGPATVALVQREIFRSGRTYKKIGEDADLCQSTVMHIAHGETTRPALRTIVRLLIALGWNMYAIDEGTPR